MRTLAAELSKLFSLPSVWIALVAGLLVPAGVTALNAVSIRNAMAQGSETAVGIDFGYQELAFGVIGAIIIGVVAVSSEYFTESGESGGGRQITTSLTAISSRLRFLLAKAAAVAVVSALLAAAAAAATMAVIRIVLGELAPVPGSEDVPRLIGIFCYWALTALLAFGITVLTRHGVVPLSILIVNTSVVTVTYLLTRITPLAYYLPDMAGIRMFIRDLADSTVEISPLVGGLVMSVWVAALFTVAAIVFCRRDA
ncbi:ABC transporter permease [Paenibacillaceae bacterium WGS1546]|uniref:ABC transporter permease n=1 Tax=Cohnella sp. WGS1546 TaxID=3366810 RepID=UPI00372D35FF